MDISHEDRGRAARDAYGTPRGAPPNIQRLIAAVFAAHPIENIDQHLALGAACVGNRFEWLAEIARQRAELAQAGGGDAPRV